MILWINGTFGSGKTTLSYELNYLIDHSLRYDPELLGEHLMKTIPKRIAENDFQHYKAWREMVVSVLSELSAKMPDTLIIVPMTLTNKKYRQEIFCELSGNGIQVAEVILTISADKLIENLKSRHENTKSWAFKQFKNKEKEIEACLDVNKLCVDNLLIDEVVQKVAKMFDFPLGKDKRNQLSKWIMRKFLYKRKDSFV
jgi:tRNA uridine 5-carbamoylmethylation protein Kti12